ncbi:hypothetical protein GE543_12450 [Pseudomonas sp. SZ57]|uniref:general secretion pathway protein GspK n=1 Tax=Pseudomonas TaxID=286 RepID=UPI0011C4961C|nr:MULTISPECIES: general secretion pathway protein GspK [Pseudomonas]MCF8982241.1 hypothetical protein [Pseudomonas syringae]MCL6310335.1 hypothetical protein [Pseudomonas syringae]MQQ35120.1 hypothetical protein [Pseudomonas sp. SZ57]
MLWAISIVIVESRQAQLAIDRSTAYAAARGGVIFTLNLLSSEAKARGSYFPLSLSVGEAQLKVIARSERGKLDVNYGNLSYINRLLVRSNVNNNRATEIVELLKKRRAQSNIFLSTAEFQLYADLDGRVFKKISPYITVWAGPGTIDFGASAPELLSALGFRAVKSFPKLGSIFTLEVYVNLKNGFNYQLTQTIRLQNLDHIGRANVIRSEDSWFYHTP